MKINLTIPVYNEQEHLETQINTAVKFFNKNLHSKFIIEIIIANNGSNDLTTEIGNKLSKKFKNVNILNLKQKGIGRAIKKSWDLYNYDVLGYTDLDFSIDLKHILKTLEILESNIDVDVVSGCRYTTKSKVLKRSIQRTFLSKTYNLILQYFLNAKFKDGACGYKFVRKKCYKILKKNLISNSFFFSTELLLFSQINKLKIYDQPVICIENSPSKIRILKTSLYYITSIIAFKFRNINDK